MVLEEGPLKTAAENNDGVIKQELINYRIIDGTLYKEVITRQFRSDGDYTDHTVTVKTMQLGDGIYATGEVEPKSRKTLIEGVYDDPEKVEESLLAKFFSNGAIGDYSVAARVNNQPQLV